MSLLTPAHIKELIGCQIVSGPSTLAEPMFIKEIFLDSEAQRPVVALINTDKEHVSSKFFNAIDVTKMGVYLTDDSDSLVSIAYFLKQIAPELPILDYSNEQY